jgi:hypothetical protein
VPDPPLPGQDSHRLDVFPGAATPAVFRARAPFWIGYGFAVDPGDGGAARRALAPDTTFELRVDGERVPMSIRSRAVKGRTVAKQCTASFEEGLEPGWHRFEGRWYDAGALTLASDVSVEFVE